MMVAVKWCSQNMCNENNISEIETRIYELELWGAGEIIDYTAENGQIIATVWKNNNGEIAGFRHDLTESMYPDMESKIDFENKIGESQD